MSREEDLSSLFDDGPAPGEATDVSQRQIPEDDELRLLVAELVRDLDHGSYYAFLGVLPDAIRDEIRDAFHERARLLHPDRYWASEDHDLRAQVYAVYKRITEAYRVLSDAERRRQYDAGLGQGQARWAAQTERQAVGPRSKDHALKNPKAKQLYRAADEARKKGDWKAVRTNLQLALAIEPDSDMVKRELEEARTKP